MPSVSRMGDMCTGVCCCHSNPTCRGTQGRLIVSSANSGSQAQGVGTLTSMIMLFCGHTSKVVVASSRNYTNSKGKSRVTDLITGCFTGKMIIGASRHNSG